MTSRGLDILDEKECYRLLRQQTLGRIGFKLASDAVIFPVYFAVLGNDIVFRTDPGTKLIAAVMGVRVAFEVDSTDPEWSVLLSGHAHEVRNAAEYEEARGALGGHWAEGERASIVRIHVDRISGRRVRREAVDG